LAFDGVARQRAFAAGKVWMKQRLARGDNLLGSRLFVGPDFSALAPVKFNPAIRGIAGGVSVHPAIEIAIDGGVALTAFGRGEEVPRLCRRRIEDRDLAGGAADADVDPARVVHGDAAGILQPVLPIERTVVLENARLRVERCQAAVRIRGRPDRAVVGFGQAHRHLRCRPVEKRERPFHRIEFAEVAAKVGVVFVAAGEERGKRAVSRPRIRCGELLAPARFRIDHQQGIAAAMVVKPDQHDVAALAIDGGDHAAMIAERGGDPVVGEALPEILRRGGRGRQAEEEEQEVERYLQHAAFKPVCHSERSEESSGGGEASVNCAGSSGFFAALRMTGEDHA
jgi:hypothetical protein